MESPTVPFGKYRGQPLSEMLADKKYVDWVKTQPELIAKYDILKGLSSPKPRLEENREKVGRVLAAYLTQEQRNEVELSQSKDVGLFLIDLFDRSLAAYLGTKPKKYNKAKKGESEEEEEEEEDDRPRRSVPRPIAEPKVMSSGMNAQVEKFLKKNMAR